MRVYCNNKYTTHNTSCAAQTSKQVRKCTVQYLGGNLTDLLDRGRECGRPLAHARDPLALGVLLALRGCRDAVEREALARLHSGIGRRLKARKDREVAQAGRVAGICRLRMDRRRGMDEHVQRAAAVAAIHVVRAAVWEASAQVNTQLQVSLPIRSTSSKRKK